MEHDLNILMIFGIKYKSIILLIQCIVVYCYNKLCCLWLLLCSRDTYKWIHFCFLHYDIGAYSAIKSLIIRVWLNLPKASSITSSLSRSLFITCEARSVQMTDVELKLIRGHTPDQHPDFSGTGNQNPNPQHPICPNLSPTQHHTQTEQKKALGE